MELMEGGKTYGKHKLKVRAYIKAKKLIRKAKKTFPTKGDPITLMAMGRGDEKGREEEERRRRREQEERRERNRLWRERRRGVDDRPLHHIHQQDALPQPQVAEKVRAVEALLTCTACSLSLRGKVWQCQLGHPVCERCVDLTWLRDDDNDDDISTLSQRPESVSALDTFSQISDNSVKRLIENMTEDELVEFLNESETGSNLTFSGPLLSERQIMEMDWFLGTLNIRKDAIQPYGEYRSKTHQSQLKELQERAEARAREESAKSEDQSEEDIEDVFDGENPWKAVPKDELELRQQESLRESFRNSSEEQEDEVESGHSDSTMLAPSYPTNRVQPIDWFAGTLEVKKDVIRPYHDYHSKQETIRTVRIDDNVEIFQSDDDDDSIAPSDSASMAGRTRVRECRDCAAPILGRNLYIENLAKLSVI